MKFFFTIEINNFFFICEVVLQSAPIKCTSNDISRENDLPQTSRNKITNHPHPRWTICYFCFTFFFVTDTKYSLHPLWFVFALFFRYLRFVFSVCFSIFHHSFLGNSGEQMLKYMKYSSNNKGATLVSTKSVTSKKSNQKSRTHTYPKLTILFPMYTVPTRPTCH